MNKAGECVDSPIPFVVAADPNAPSTSFSLDFLENPNPMGYCWTVMGTAENQKVSPPAEGAFRYYHTTLDREPGKDFDATFSSEIIPGKSYGGEITFTWDAAHPEALGYVMWIGKFPWVSAWTAPQYPWNAFLPASQPFGDSMAPLEISGPPVKLSGPDVSEGRYCWAVWPVLGNPDPAHTGEPWELQPLVSTADYCYTTGPGEPVPDVDDGPPPPDVGFTGAAISGTFTLPYAAEAQFEILASSTDPTEAIQFTYELTDCEQEYFYGDVYDCEVRFTIVPLEGHTYWVWAYTYNYGPEPIHKIHTQALFAGVCGGVGEPCCDGTGCDTFAEICDTAKNVCVSCGLQDGDPCCTDPSHPDCLGDHLFCDGSNGSGKCIECGLELGEPCCPVDTSWEPCSESRWSCNPTTDRCEHCGTGEEGCCTETPACDPGLTCTGSKCTCVVTEPCSGQEDCCGSDCAFSIVSSLPKKCGLRCGDLGWPPCYDGDTYVCDSGLGALNFIEPETGLPATLCESLPCGSSGEPCCVLTDLGPGCPISGTDCDGAKCP